MAKIQFKAVILDDEGDELELTMPGRHVVCHRCEGRGTHVNPAVDGNGISAEEFAEDPDFAESYVRGDYDVQCEKCGGARVLVEIDRDAADPEDVRRYDEYQLETARERDAAYESERWLRYHETGVMG